MRSGSTPLYSQIARIECQLYCQPQSSPIVVWIRSRRCGSRYKGRCPAHRASPPADMWSSGATFPA